MDNKFLKLGLIVGGVIALYFIGILISGLFSGGSDAPKKGPTIEFWNVFDTSDTMRPILDDFTKATGIEVNYRGFTDIANYRKTLLQELASGEGPDVLAFHYGWLGRDKKLLLPMPDGVGPTPDAVRDTFVDAVGEQMLGKTEIKNGNKKETKEVVWGLPMYVDSLGLIYNEDMYKSVLGKPSARPAETWAGIRDEVDQLATPDENASDGFTLAGIAMGRADNISRAVELFYALFLQNGGASLADADGSAHLNQVGADTLDFFTRFARNTNYPEYSWNEKMGGGEPEGEVDAFIHGRVAMIVGYSYYLDRIGSLIDNAMPGATIKKEYVKATTIPQVEDPAKGGHKVAYADYFALGVPKATNYPRESWILISYLTSRDAEQAYFTATGKPASRRDLLVLESTDARLGAFAKQAVYARTLTTPDADATSDALTLAIDAIADGDVDVSSAVSSFDRYLTCLLREESHCRFAKH